MEIPNQPGKRLRFFRTRREPVPGGSSETSLFRKVLKKAVHSPGGPSGFTLALTACLLWATIAIAGQGEVYRCATSEDVHQALKTVKAGDTILLEGGSVYEIDKSFVLKADGYRIAPGSPSHRKMTPARTVMP